MNGISIALLAFIWFMAACSTEAEVWSDDAVPAPSMWELLLDNEEAESGVTDAPAQATSHFQTFGEEPTIDAHQTTIGPLAAGVGVFMLSMLLTTSIRFRRRHQ